jgi:hypothetical protein
MRSTPIPTDTDTSADTGKPMRSALIPTDTDTDTDTSADTGTDTEWSRSTLIPTDHWQLTLVTRMTLATASLVLMLLVPSARAAETSQPMTLLQLEVAVRAHPGKAAAAVTQFLEAGPNGSVSSVGKAVAATMRGLGPSAKGVSVGRVMLAVTKARPDGVLETMRVAIPLTKKDVHQEMVAASVSGIAAVADLYMPISVKPADGGAVGYERSESASGNGPVQVVAGMSFVQGATLAEDIVQVAFQSGSHENLASLSKGANGVLTSQSGPDPLANLGQLPFRPPVETPAPVSP